MRVLFLSAANNVHTVRWVNALAERGCRVVLVSEKNHQAKEDTIADKVKIVYLPFGGTKGYYLNVLALRHIYEAGKFDVINVHYASGYGTLARMAKLPGIILNVWGSDVYDFPYQNRLKEIILRKNLSYATKIASTSHSMARQTENFLEEKKNITITPFGVDIQKFKSIPKKSDSEFIFGIVKTLSPKYGIDMVIEAFDVFLKKVSQDRRLEIRLEIYGQGELLDELQELVLNKKLEKQIHFGGYIENNKLPDVLNKMDVFLLGSRLESFGVAAVEAMACGLPIVATKVSGFEEVLEDGKTGYLVPIDDTEAMAEKMMALYVDKELRKRMGANGRKRVKILYDWEKNVEKMINLYLE